MRSRICETSASLGYLGWACDVPNAVADVRSLTITSFREDGAAAPALKHSNNALGYGCPLAPVPTGKLSAEAVAGGCTAPSAPAGAATSPVRKNHILCLSLTPGQTS